MLIPELNLGQLLMLVRARYLIDAVGYNKVRGKPFRIVEIETEAERILAGGGAAPSDLAAAAAPAPARAGKDDPSAESGG